MGDLFGDYIVSREVIDFAVIILTCLVAYTWYKVTNYVVRKK